MHSERVPVTSSVEEPELQISTLRGFLFQELVHHGRLLYILICLDYQPDKFLSQILNSLWIPFSRFVEMASSRRPVAFVAIPNQTPNTKSPENPKNLTLMSYSFSPHLLTWRGSNFFTPCLDTLIAKWLSRLIHSCLIFKDQVNTNTKMIQLSKDGHE